MDPNEALKQLLKICRTWEEWGDLELDPTDSMDTASELVVALHEWITNGGFLPDDWK